MNRKDFLALTVPFAATVSAIAGKSKELNSKSKIPPYLKAGDIIGITSPSGFIMLEDVQPAVKKLSEWGFNCRIGNTIGKRDFTFGGTDEERAADLQQMLDDPQIKAILFARGGYGGVRIIDKLDFSRFLKHPKWLIGFSDATLFHVHVNGNFGIASLHSKMCNSFPADWNLADQAQVETINSINECLTGKQMTYKAPHSEHNRLGEAEGILVGGNLSIIENTSGTASDINTDGKILFLEEVGEYKYSIDRMLWNLARAKKFQKLKGLIIGGFRVKADDPGEEFGLQVHQTILEKVKQFSYPVAFDFPVGHQRNNFALKCGVMHRLKASSAGTELTSL
jgi:muramoyltetrapeptide carboxypeptidase